MFTGVDTTYSQLFAMAGHSSSASVTIDGQREGIHGRPAAPMAGFEIIRKINNALSFN
jgi:hypothetical protein